MTYVPTIITKADFDSILFRNIYNLVSEYSVANAEITVQDREKNATYPLYTIYVPDVIKKLQDNRNRTTHVPVSFQIDFDALPGNGDWQKTTEMQNKLENGFETEKTLMRGAGIAYIGSETLSSEPIDINGQQVFSKAVRFDFTVMI